MSTATIKFGQGYEAPWLVAEHDDADEIKKFLIVAAGLDEKYYDEPLIKVQIHASRLARGYYDAMQEDDKPAERSENAPVPPPAEQPKKRNTKGGLAAQAKAAEQKFDQAYDDAHDAAEGQMYAEPADVTNSIESLIANVMSADEAKELHTRFKADWKPEHTEQIKARLKELGGK